MKSVTIFVKVSFKICKPGHVGVNIAWVDVVHNNVLPCIRVHLPLVDPDGDCIDMMVVMLMMMMRMMVMMLMMMMMVMMMMAMTC